MTKIVGANINLSYVKIANFMVKKHTSKRSSITNGVDDVIIINSFDGAEAFKSRKNVSGIISFSLSLMTEGNIIYHHIYISKFF